MEEHAADSLLDTPVQPLTDEEVANDVEESKEPQLHVFRANAVNDFYFNLYKRDIKCVHVDVQLCKDNKVVVHPGNVSQKRLKQLRNTIKGFITLEELLKHTPDGMEVIVDIKKHDDRDFMYRVIRTCEQFKGKKYTYMTKDKKYCKQINCMRRKCLHHHTSVDTFDEMFSKICVHKDLLEVAELDGFEEVYVDGVHKDEYDALKEKHPNIRGWIVDLEDVRPENELVVPEPVQPTAKLDENGEPIRKKKEKKKKEPKPQNVVLNTGPSVADALQRLTQNKPLTHRRAPPKKFVPTNDEMPPPPQRPSFHDAFYQQRNVYYPPSRESHHHRHVPPHFAPPPPPLPPPHSQVPPHAHSQQDLTQPNSVQVSTGMGVYNIPEKFMDLPFDKFRKKAKYDKHLRGFMKDLRKQGKV
jgi:hypothetical protein